MFSRRLPAHLQGNRLSAALAARRAAGQPILDLTESNPTRAFPPPDLAHAFASPAIARYDPCALGSPAARAAVARRYSAVHPEDLVLTSSTSESYSWLFKLLADPGDEILVPRPSYPLFDFLAAFESVRAAPYRLECGHRWRIDLESVESALTARTRALVIVNPNNPTGSFLRTPERDALLDLAQRHALALISDEVFFDYPFDDRAARASLLGPAPALTFTLSGLSKVAGLPQMKLGWIIVGGPPPLKAAALERLELIADTYLPVGTPVQVAAPALLALAEDFQAALRARLSANLASLRRLLAAHPAFELLPAEGGWYATLRVPRVRSEEEWALELLERCGVLVQPGYFYDFESEAFLVLSLMTPPEAFREGVARLLAL